MANKKITELPFIDTISGSSVFDNPILNTVVPVVMYGTTNQITIENYAKFINLYNAHTGSAGNTFAGPQTINNNVTINGKLTVHEIVAQYETASILFSTGSTKLGDQLTDKHEFTGSTNITGALYYNDVLVTNIDANTIEKLQQATASLQIQTGSQDLVNLQISSTTGSINETTSSFDSVFLGISSVTGSFRAEIGGIEEYTASLKGQAIVSSSTQITNYHKFAETASANTFYGNQNITGSLSVSAGEFNVITGSGNMTSSLIFDHTQNDGVTLGLRHNDRLSLADHTFNVNVWAAGVYTTFVRNGTPYSILNVEAFDDNKIYLYRDTRLYNKSLTIDKELLVKQGAKITGSLSVISGSGDLTSSIGFVPVDYDLVQGASVFEVRHINNIYPEELALKLSVSDTSGTLFFEKNGSVYNVLSVGGNSNNLFISRDTRLLGKGLTIDNELLVKQNTQLTGSLIVLSGITGSLLSTNGVVSSSNQLFELNGQTGSQDTINFNISVVTSSIDAHILGISIYTASAITTNNSIDAHILAQSIQTASQDLVNYNISVVTSSIDAHILKQATQTGSQDLVNLGISSVTGSLIGITNGLMTYTASLKAAEIVSSSTQITNYYKFAETASANTFYGNQKVKGNLDIDNKVSVTGSLIVSSSANQLWATPEFQLYNGLGTVNFALTPNTGNQLQIQAYGTKAEILQANEPLRLLSPELQIVKYDNTPTIVSVTGSVDVKTGGITGSILATNGVISGSAQIDELTQIAGIEAYTASLKGAIEVSGQNVNVLGMITAQQFNVTFVSSSVMYQSGSNKFGNSGDDKHEFTGSVDVIGSITASGNLQANQLYVGGATTSTGLIGASEAVVQNELGIQYGDATGTYMRIIANGANSNTAIQVGAFSGAEPSLDLIAAGGSTAISIKSDANVNFSAAVTASGTLSVGGSGFVSPGGADKFIGVFSGQDSSIILQDSVETWEMYMNDDLYFTTGSSNPKNVMSLRRVTGNVEINEGNLVIGKAGKGIDFSITSNGSGTTSSELLNDYEEGTWTPSMTTSVSGTITIDSGASVAHYTKIGRQVTVKGSFYVSSVSSPVGEWRIGGLPFTSKAVNSLRSALSVFVDGLETTATTSVMGYIDQNVTYATIYKYSAGAVATIGADVKANSYVFFTGTYFVD